MYATDDLVFSSRKPLRCPLATMSVKIFSSQTGTSEPFMHSGETWIAVESKVVALRRSMESASLEGLWFCR